MKIVYILRGPPGAGKSNYAAVLRERHGQVTVCSADDYFVTAQGEYRFDPTKLPEAHARCMYGFLNALAMGHEVVVVDNTFTRRWEYVNYFAAAKLVGYTVKIVEILPRTVEEVKTCAARNVHGVPPEVVARMVMDFQTDLLAETIPIPQKKLPENGGPRAMMA